MEGDAVQADGHESELAGVQFQDFAVVGDYAWRAGLPFCSNPAR